MWSWSPRVLSPYPRGTPTRAYRTAEAVAQRGHKVDVITYHLGQPTQHAPFAIHRTPPIKQYQRLEPGPTYGRLRRHRYTAGRQTVVICA